MASRCASSCKCTRAIPPSPALCGKRPGEKSGTRYCGSYIPAKEGYTERPLDNGRVSQPCSFVRYLRLGGFTKRRIVTAIKLRERGEDFSRSLLGLPSSVWLGRVGGHKQLYEEVRGSGVCGLHNFSRRALNRGPRILSLFRYCGSLRLDRHRRYS